MYQSNRLCDFPDIYGDVLRLAQWAALNFDRKTFEKSPRYSRRVLYEYSLN